jgi:hypothetical protein
MHLPATIVPNAIRLCQMPSDCAKCHQIMPNAMSGLCQMPSDVPNAIRLCQMSMYRLKFNIDFAEGFIPKANLKVNFLC